MPANEDADTLVISNDPLHVWSCYKDVIGVSLFIAFPQPANLIPELCRSFYHLGWVTGTGGGISIRAG